MTSDELTRLLLGSVEAAIGPVRTRRMFGATGLWSDETFFGMIWDGALSVRLDEAREAEYIARGFCPNDPLSKGKGRKRYYEVPADIVESPDELGQWLMRSVDSARGSHA
jgi:DNA transformation protein